MTADVRAGSTGRGAWPASGRGGTLSADGTGLGPWYRAPAPGRTLPLIGTIARRAVDADVQVPVGLDEYATYSATMSYQALLKVDGARLDVDGRFGKLTATAVQAWQASHGLFADGVLGPRTARAMWQPFLDSACVRIEDGPRGVSLRKLCRGHVGIESGWDCGAVGVTTPADVGLGQINGPAHPELSLDERLDPLTAVEFIARFVDGNLIAFNYNERDAIASYMLGQGGCRTWIKAGRPATWQRLVNGARTTIYVARYIDSVLAAALP